MDSPNRKNAQLRVKVAIAGIFIIAGTVMGVALYNRYSVLATGTFHPVDRPGTGWVRIISQCSRQRLELIDMTTPDEGEAEVRLMATSDALDSITAESTVGRLVGILPAGARSGSFLVDPPIDLRRFRAVMLWSAAKHLNLITAPLQVSEQPYPGAN
jgi:hypothetical protein